jgi:hypothetical protein
MIKDDLKFYCALEPDDDRNFMTVEDFTVNLSITVQHVAYRFWYRLKCALRLLFTGIDANDITITSDDAKSLVVWVSDWLDSVPDDEDE